MTRKNDKENIDSSHNSVIDTLINIETFVLKVPTLKYNYVYCNKEYIEMLILDYLGSSAVRKTLV